MINPNANFGVLVVVVINEGIEAGTFLAKVIIERVDGISDALKVSVGGFIQQRQEQGACLAIGVDPLQGQVFGDRDKVTIMPEKYPN